MITKGALAVIFVWIAVCIAAIAHPWIGVIAYFGFGALCPQWNWRWDLADFSFQKFIAISTVVGFVVSGIRSQKWSNTTLYSFMGFLVYVFFVFLSSLQTINPGKTSMYWDITWKTLLLYWIGLACLNNSKRLLWLIAVLVVSQGWNAFNINQLYFERGFVNVNNFSWNYLDNNTYSISSVPIMALTFAAVVSLKDQRVLAVGGGILLLQIHQIMILQSRGTMIGVLATLGLGVWFMEKTKRAVWIVGLAAMAGVMLAGPSVVEEFTSSFRSENELDASAESRLKLWRAGLAIMRDYPLLGVGPWGGEVMVPQYYTGDLKGQKVKALHNLFFEVGTGSGIISVFAYLLFFFIPWYEHFRIWRAERAHFEDWFRLCNLGVLAGIPGYWIASMFSSGALIESPYALVLVGCCALAIHVVKQEQATSEENWDAFPEVEDGEWEDRNEPARSIAQ